MIETNYEVKDVLFMSAEENLQEFKKIVEFIKSLDDEGIEMFIEVARETAPDSGDEDDFRETLRNIRDREF